MYKQIFFLLLFLLPLSLHAQQLQGDAKTLDQAFFFGDNGAAEIGAIPTRTMTPASLPEAPLPRTESVMAVALYRPAQPQPPRFALERTPVFSKTFVAVHAAFLGSIVYDTELTHQGLAHHQCVESNHSLGPRPSRGEMYTQNLLTFSAVTSLDWFMAKLKIRYLPYVAPAAPTVVHLTGGSKWLAECW